MIETILLSIRRAGLVPRGALALAADERGGVLGETRTLVLAGMAGREGWDTFAASAEAADGFDHPLDRWSRRVIEALACDFGALALFPFGEPHFHPFQQWARRAEPVHPSPTGLLIHPAYGLWHSYRGALGFCEALNISEPAAAPSPCDSCRERPCMNACPVGAFSAAGYNVAACAGYLTDGAGADCMGAGCQARRACPIGVEHAYGAVQANFIMRAFLRAREPLNLTRRD